MNDDTLDDFIKKINPNAKIFVDLDGTLVNTDQANTSAYLKALFELYGITLNNTQSFGRITQSTLKGFGLLYNQIQETVSCKKEIYPTFLHLTKINNEILDFIKNNYKTHDFYLVSSGDKCRVKQVLEYHDLLYLFKDIICHSTEKYKYAINILNLEINDVFIFENCTNDIENAISMSVNANHIFHINGDF